MIMPHKAMHVLPLHLMNRKEGGIRRHLVDEYTVSFSPSFEMVRPRKRKNGRVNKSLVAVADPTDELTGSREEVRYISAYFDRSKIIEGEDAVITEVIRSAPDACVIHLACHGEFDMIDPYQSCLILALPKDDSLKKIKSKKYQVSTIINSHNHGKICEVHSLGGGESETVQYDFRGRIKSRMRSLADGRKIVIDPSEDRPIGEPWTLAGILKELKLPQTVLAVLSACESGVVDSEKLPDEYLGLAAGFLAAGAETAVSTLWKVSDDACCALMKAFYRNMIKKEMRPAEALQKAQLALRSDRRFLNSFYWGAFQVSGQG